MADSSKSQPYSVYLFLWLCLKVIAMIAVIFFLGIGLGPDEGQYWTWSQALDWGYYSKPPGIAWQIWLGTKFFGQTEWGVRSLSVLVGLFQGLAVYFLAIRAGLKAQTAFWSGLMMAFSPLGILGSLFAVTDGGFLLCWTGACLTVASALQEKRAPNPFVVGVWVVLGALYKWPIYLFWFFYLCCRQWYFPEQKKMAVLKGVSFSLLGLLPSVWWNSAHDWATFRHVFTTLKGGNVNQITGNFGSFIGSQAGLLSPILFVLLILALWTWCKKKRELSPSLFFFGFMTLSIMSSAVIASFFQKIQGNWIAFAYPTGFVLIGWFVFETGIIRQLWVKLGLGLSIVLMMIALLLPSLYTTAALSNYAQGYRLNPLKHNIGWNALEEALIKEGYQVQDHFLVSDKYQTTSLLSFYNPGQKRAYFLNLHDSRRNQFSYWPSLQAEQVEKSGFFVWVENIPYLKKEWKIKKDFYESHLQDYFESVGEMKFVPLVYEGPEIVKAAMIFKCEGCRHITLIDSNHY